MNTTLSVSPFVTYAYPVFDLTSHHAVRVDPISDETLNLLSKVFNAATLAICISGICTNTMTVHTFYRMGLEDSMTISFFFLAVCDFGNCFIVCVSCLCDVCNILVDEGVLEVGFAPYIPFFYINSSRMVFSMATAILKVYMAIQRCLCVALPFHVRGFFTRRRTFLFVGLLFAITAFWTILLLSGHAVKTITIPAYNITYSIIHRIAELEVFVDHQEFIGSVVFSTGYQVISWVCFIVMMVALKKSERFRKSATHVLPNNSQKDKTLDVADETKERETSKEKQVLIQVTLLTGIFCFTGGLYMIQGLCSLLIPGYTFTREYRNLYLTAYMCATFAEILNSTGNVLIYLRFNSKFRNSFVYTSRTKR